MPEEEKDHMGREEGQRASCGSKAGKEYMRKPGLSQPELTKNHHNFYRVELKILV